MKKNDMKLLEYKPIPISIHEFTKNADKICEDAVKKINDLLPKRKISGTFVINYPHLLSEK